MLQGALLRAKRMLRGAVHRAKAQKGDLGLTQAQREASVLGAKGGFHKAQQTKVVPG